MKYLVQQFLHFIAISAEWLFVDLLQIHI